jgi:DNA-binding protein H-NS
MFYEYSKNIQVDPIHRLGLHMLQLDLAVDSHNKKMKADNTQQIDNTSEKISTSTEQIPKEDIQKEEIPAPCNENIDEINERKQNLMQGL